MAARKEILDFIQMMRNHQTRPSLESVSDQTLKVVEIYNERKGDHFTLKNDMWELVTSAISNERRGIERTSFDFVSAITILLQTAADWGLYLPDTEIQRYEGVKIGLYDNLAKEIRQIYSHPHRQPDVTKRDTPPEPQRWESKIEGSSRALGRKRIPVKDLILLNDKDKVFTKLKENLKGKSKDAAMEILINNIKNGTLMKPSWNAFCDAFPMVEIKEGTYYYKLRKAGI